METRTIAIYCRLSVDRSGASESPERQEAACRQLIESKGWTVGEVFVDRDISAFSKTRRPAYEAMLRGIRDGSFGGVAVFKMDRLTRRFIETARIIETLETAGAVLLSVHDAIDTSTPMGQAIVGFIVAQAEQESLNTSLRVSSAAEASALRGDAHSGSSRCFGYNRDGSVNPEEAELGREAARRVIAGESLRSVAFDFAKRGVTTTAGKAWDPSRLAKWLRSARPAGMRHHGGNEIQGNWEPIIPPAMRLDLMHAIAARGKGRSQSNKVKRLLPGLAYCGVCGGRLKSMGFVMKNGKTFPRYSCVKQPGKVNCGGINASEKALDAVVRDEFLDFMSSTELRPLPEGRNAETLAAALDADRLAMSDLTRARFVERVISPEDFDAARVELQARITAGEGTLAAWERDAVSRDGVLRPGDRESLAAWWEAASLEDRRLALGNAIARVVVNKAAHRGGNVFQKERVRIQWKWSLYRQIVSDYESRTTPEERAAAEETYLEETKAEHYAAVEEMLAEEEREVG